MLLAALLLCAFILFLQRAPSSGPTEPVSVLDTFSIPVTPRDRFRLTLGANRKWVSRAEQRLFGERKSIRVSAEIIQLTPPTLTNFETIFNLGRPIFTGTNDLKVWFIDAPQSPTNKIPGVEILSRPRLLTAEGMGASMFMGTSVPTGAGMTQVGLGIQCAALIHDESIEMLMRVEQSEPFDQAIKTNLNLNVRLNVPKRKGVFLFQRPNASATNGWAVMIHPLH